MLPLLNEYPLSERHVALSTVLDRRDVALLGIEQSALAMMTTWRCPNAWRKPPEIEVWKA